MEKVAAISKRTMPISEENHTLFGLVEAIFLVVLPKFMGAMSKLTFVFVGTITMFDELFA
jgi:hypothetical protein